MESKVKSMGHPIHPMLVNFPLGLLVTAAVFDIIHLVTGNGYWSGIAFWMIAAGVISGVLAAIIGTIDALAIPPGTRAKSVSIVHGSGNFFILVLFVVSWILRSSTPGNPSITAYVLSFLGAALLGVTGWLGGELTLRLGIGVDEGANLNAPSSLSGLPASQNITDSNIVIRWVIDRLLDKLAAKGLTQMTEQAQQVSPTLSFGSILYYVREQE